MHGSAKPLGGIGSAWHKYEVRAFKLVPESLVAGKTVQETESMFPDEASMFVVRVRRGNQIQDATSDLMLQVGDTVSVIGPREQIIGLLGKASPEVDDPELLSDPVEGVDVFVSNKEADGKTLEELGSCRARAAYMCAPLSVERARHRFPSCPTPSSSAAT